MTATGSWVCPQCSILNSPNILKCQCGFHLGYPMDEYQTLKHVFHLAYKQAAEGKGKERHAEVNQRFEDQLICQIEKLNVGFQLGQAIKKIMESARLDKDRAVEELLGAINYIAAKVILLKEE